MFLYVWCVHTLKFNYIRLTQHNKNSVCLVKLTCVYLLINSEMKETILSLILINKYNIPSGHNDSTKLTQIKYCIR